jgi:hypothetical protein
MRGDRRSQNSARAQYWQGISPLINFNLALVIAIPVAHTLTIIS